jgi:hypothetical protein
MALKTINIATTKVPEIDTKFSEQVVNSNIGPTPVLPANVSLESHAIQPIEPKNAAVWSPMTAFDSGLKTALINFIDTGRAKKIDFFFYGTTTKSVKPSEVGHFQLVLSYPPNITNQNININGKTTS